MNFSKLLIKFRANSGISKTEIANKVSVTPGYLMHLESGRIKPPTLTRVRQISDALRLSKEEADELIQAAARERIRPEELEIVQQVRENRGKVYEWSTISGSSTCPHCQKDIEIEVDQKGNVTVTGKVVAKVKKY